MSASSTLTASGQQIDIGAATLTATSTLVCAARKKWENEPDTAESWAAISDTAETWAPVADTAETWTEKTYPAYLQAA